MYKEVYLVWYGNMPIEPFDTEEEANKKVEELNKKENTNKYFVRKTNYGPAIFI